MDLLAETINTTVIAKGIIIGFGGMGPAIALGLMGAAYMNAVSRNPEASKFLSTLFIFVGMAEFFGIVAIGAFFIVK
jgi:F0F1-type ATP synthase membrane subunit c/vacuolar-type H+-ATPase subunit K